MTTLSDTVVPPPVALDKALAHYLALERRDFEQAVEGVLEGYEDVKAGRARDAAIFLNELRRKYGLPG